MILYSLTQGIRGSFLSIVKVPNASHVYYPTTLYFPKSDRPWQTEAGTEHLLVGTDQPHIVDREFHILIACASDTVIDSDLVPDTLRDPFADIDVVLDLVS